VKGAQKGGFLGLAKGIGKGLTGLITKPVVGTIDAVSMTTKGLKNQIS
jgi:hypothetical protein